MQIEGEDITTQGEMVRRYIKYLFQSRTRYGIHSPFVYDLYSNVILDRKKYSEYKIAENIRCEMQGDHSEIEFTDLGTGKRSKCLKDTRRVNQIISAEGSSVKYGRLLFRLSRHFKSEYMLELGTSLGVGSLYLESGNPGGHLITIEGCAAVAAIASKNFMKAGCEINQLVGDFDKCLPEILAKREIKIGLIYFDGNHSYDATLRYFEMCLEAAGENSVFIFDDIQWSDGMRKAWSEIKTNDRVIVTIDLFSLGIVFFNPALSKENFLLRF